MYFTSYSEYAANYYCKVNEEGEKILILTYVTPGNVYPVVEDPDSAEETLKGKPFKNGYQSHCVLGKYITVANTRSEHKITKALNIYLRDLGPT